MVVELVKQGYLRTEKVIKAFSDTPRHLFLRRQDLGFAYSDHPVSIPGGQTISAPHMVSIMTELLEASASDKVLEIGAGSGYQAAVLSKLVGKIYSVETDSELVGFARANLKEAGVRNVEVIKGDGSRGYEREKPYDKIIVTCATPEIFDSWIKQLKTNGILLAPVGGSGFYQELIRIRKTKKGIETTSHGGCAFVPLRR